MDRGACRQFEQRHPVGTMARLALALYLNFGVRKGDVIRIGPRMIKAGELVDFQPQKTSRNGGKKITVPLLEETKAIIAATPLIGAGTYLVNQWGKPFTAQRVRQQDAGVVRRGRPAGSVEPWPAETVPDPAGRGRVSAPAIASISGHKDLREIQLYIDAADRKKLAARDLRRWNGTKRERDDVKPNCPDWQFGENVEISRVKTRMVSARGSHISRKING